MRHAMSVPLLAGLAALALIFGTGCSSNDSAGGASNTRAATPDAQATADRGNGPVTAKRGGTPIKVTWEALAHERYLYENPRYGRRPGSSVKPDFAIVLVNESHPEADQIRQGRVRGGENIGSGVLSDRQMSDLLLGLEKIGYFKAAKSTTAQARFFDDDRSRGRVTVDRPIGSTTLLSMRGQGLSSSTKHIPGIYSQAKQAIAMLKNQSRTLTVETIGRGDLPYR